MKMSGADFRAFLDSKDPTIWPPGLYIEEELLRVNGVESELQQSYADDDVVEIVGGATAWEDRSKERDTPTLKTLARRWLKTQNTLRLVVSVPKDRLDNLRALVNSIGGTVV